MRIGLLGFHAAFVKVLMYVIKAFPHALDRAINSMHSLPHYLDGNFVVFFLNNLKMFTKYNNSSRNISIPM